MGCAASTVSPSLPMAMEDVGSLHSMAMLQSPNSLRSALSKSRPSAVQEQERQTLQNLMSEARSKPRRFSQLQHHIVKVSDGAPAAANEAERLGYLHTLGVLNAEPDARLDEITVLMTQIFMVPAAMVTLIDENQQWVKSGQGPMQCGHTFDRKLSMCAWTLLPAHPEMLVIEDMSTDVRFAHNPFVEGEAHARFYAGAPLVAEGGLRLGTVCVLDIKPRTFDTESCVLLCNIADLVVRELQRKCQVAQAKQAADSKTPQPALTSNMQNCMTQGTLLLDVSRPKWDIMFASEACPELMGLTRDQIVGKPLWEVVSRDGMTKEDSWDLYATCPEEIDQGAEFTVSVRPCHPQAQANALTMCFWPAYKEVSSSQAIAIPGDIPAPNPSTLGPNVTRPYFVTVGSAMERVSGSMQMTDAEIEAASRTTMSPREPLPVEDVATVAANDKLGLGALLQKTAHGRLCRGTVGDKPCLIKITSRMEHPPASKPKKGEAAPPTCPEVECTRDLRHPNIAAMLSSRTVVREVDWLIKLRSPSKHQLEFESRPRTESCAQPPLGRRCAETWIMREPCDGGSLRQAITRGTFLVTRTEKQQLPSMRAILRTMHEVASAVTYMHMQHVVHCGICGDAIMLVKAADDPRGFVVKFVDFDLARWEYLPHPNPLPYHSLVHLAPETILEGLLTKESDVYAFGILLWEMFTLQLPWISALDVDFIISLTQGTVRLDWPDNTPFAYQELAQWCMARHPSNRPDFDQILDALEQLQEVAVMDNPDAWNALQLDLGNLAH